MSEQEKISISVEVNFRLPEKGEQPNYLGWFDNQIQDFTVYAPPLNYWLPLSDLIWFRLRKMAREE